MTSELAMIDEDRLDGEEKVHDAFTKGASPMGPFTLAIDVGGTGIKASVLDALGRMVADRVRVRTTYPLAPEQFIDTLEHLVRPLPTAQRVSVGFPGVVRRGHVVTAPHFVTEHGPGTTILAELESAWSGFFLADRLGQRLSLPVRVLNDADLQGLAVISGKELELVVTFGTGVGTALFDNGELAPHLELAHHLFRKDESYNEQLGEVALERIGVKKWKRRALLCLSTLKALVNYDRCYVGGGNSVHLKGEVGDDVEIVDNVAGILGGIKLWDPGLPEGHF